MSSPLILVLIFFIISLYETSPKKIIYPTPAEYPAYILFNQAVAFSSSHTSSSFASRQKTIDLYIRAIELKPDLEEAILNLGTIYMNGNSNEIETSVKMLKHLAYDGQPNTNQPYSDEMKSLALNNLGYMSQRNAGSNLLLLQESIEYYKSALTFYGEQIDVLYNLGVIYQLLGNSVNTQYYYRRVIEVDGMHMYAHLNLANYYFAVKDNLSAIDSYRKVISIYDYTHQEQSSETDVSKTPLIMAHNNLGQVYRSQNYHALAYIEFSQAQKASNGESVMASVNLFLTKRSLCFWAAADKAVHSMIKSVVPYVESSQKGRIKSGGDNWEKGRLPLLPYDGILVSQISPNLNRQLSEEVMNPFNSHKSFGKKLPVSGAANSNSCSNSSGSTSSKITVAYLSYDFRDHAMGQLTRGFILGHNRDNFKTVALSYGPNDNSTYRKSFETGVDVFIDALSGSVDDCSGNGNGDNKNNSSTIDPIASAMKVYEQSVDICVDLMTHTIGGNYQIASYKPCTLLVTYLGYPGTSGGENYDYAVLDTVVVGAEGGNGWTEKIVYLPGTYQANEYDLEIGVCGYATLSVCEDGRRVLLNSSDGGVNKNESHENDENPTLTEGLERLLTMCNFNTIDKIDRPSYTMWLNLLHRTPSSLLFLLTPSPSTVIENLHLYALSQGVNKRRIIFIPKVSHAQHTLRLSGCDMFVDTLLYGAHTTMSDNLWSALPSFTVGGYGSAGVGGTAVGSMSGGMQSRVGRSFVQNLMLMHAGLANAMVVGSVKSMEDGVSALMTEKVNSEGSPSTISMIDKIRNGIAHSLLRMPHFDTELITRNIEIAYRCMLELLELKEETQSQLETEPANNIDQNRMHIMITPELKQRTSDLSKRKENAEIFLARALKSKNSNTEEFQAIASRIAYSFPSSQRVPSSFNDHIDLAETLFSLGKYREAMNSYVNAILLNPQTAIVSGAGEAALLSLHKIEKHKDVEESELFEKICNAHLYFKQICELALLEDGRLESTTEIYGLEPSLLGSLARVISLHGGAIFESENNEFALSSRLFKLSTLLDPLNSDYFSNYAIALEALGDGNAANANYFHAVRLMYLHRSRSSQLENSVVITSPQIINNGSYDSKGKVKKTIVMYCNEYGNAWFPHWSHATLKTGGLGGSEEAIVHLARKLGVLGWLVTIYNDVKVEDAGVDPENSNVYWRHFSEYDVENPPDVFVAWRYHVSLALAGITSGLKHVKSDSNSDKIIVKPKKVYLYLQDVPRVTAYTPTFCSQVDGIFVLSGFHARFLPTGECRGKGRITPNGIDVVTDFKDGGFSHGDGDNDDFVLVYGSAPNRGLELLIELWPRIFQRILERSGRKPTLDIYYGFTQSFIKFGESGKLMTNFTEWMLTLQRKIAQSPGVLYHGMVGHSTLTKGYASAGFILYPTNYPETGCVTLMKAMASGAIPITSRLYDSTIPELTLHFDRGPSTPLSSAMSSDELEMWIEGYVEAVVTSVLEGGHEDVRNEMKVWARKRFEWANVARLWDAEFMLQ